ncbi:MAG: hypothetical protein FJY21_00830 [Bacteroidetes bacterium]|nr:hypothetical protein [Bacteroidota bacterium]
MTLRKSSLSLGVILSLIILFPWEAITPGRFEDLASYRLNLEMDTPPDLAQFESPIIFLFREVLFQKWLFTVFESSQDVELTLFIIASVTIVIFFFALKRLKIDYRLAIFFLNPLIIDFFNAQLRNSLALSLFLLGYGAKRKLFKYFFIVLSVSLHLGLLILVVVYFLAVFLKNRIKNRTLQIISLTMAAILFGFGDKIFFSLINDRRANIYSSSNGMSVIYFLWACCLFACIFVIKKRDQKSTLNIDFAFIGSLLIVLAYFSGAYYGRYLAMFFPFIILSIGTFDFRKPVIWVMSFYCFYTFVMNFVF